MDIEARKQMLLTRIALERVQWVHDMDTLREAANPRNVASRALRAAVPDGLLRSIFGSSPSGRRSSASNLGARAFHAFLLWRRYSILITLVGGMVSRLIAGRRINRLVTFATIGAGILGGIWITLQRRGRLG